MKTTQELQLDTLNHFKIAEIQSALPLIIASTKHQLQIEDIYEDEILKTLLKIMKELE